MATGQQEGDGTTGEVRQGVDLRCPAAARTTDGLAALPPFSSGRAAVGFDSGTVDQHLRRRSVGRGQGMKDVSPHALGGSAHKAVVKRLPRTINRWRVGPATAGLQDMNNPADHSPIIHPRLAPRVGGKKRLKPRKLPLAQPEIIVIHHRSPFGNLESRNRRRGNSRYGSGA